MNFIAEHLGLPAQNPAALKDWYVNMLGAKLVFEHGPTPPVYFLALPGGLMFEIYQAGSTREIADNSVAGFRHLALRVDSLAGARAELEEKGVTFPDPPKPAAGGGQVLFFRDGENNLLHFVERPKDSIFKR